MDYSPIIAAHKKIIFVDETTELIEKSFEQKDNPLSFDDSDSNNSFDPDAYEIGYNTELTYSKLCEFFNEKPHQGKGRELQLKRFSRYYDIHEIKKPNKHPRYIIYQNDCDEKKKSYLGNRYYPYFESTFMYILKHTEGNVLFITTSDLLKQVGFVNTNYIYRYLTSDDTIKEITPSLKNKEDFDSDEIGASSYDSFLKIVQKELSLIAASCLNTMKRKKLITYETTLLLYNTNDNSSSEKRYLYESEQKEFLNILSSLFEKYKVKNISMLLNCIGGKDELNKEIYGFISELQYDKYVLARRIELIYNGDYDYYNDYFFNFDEVQAIIAAKIRKNNDLKSTIPAPILEKLLNRFF